MDVHKKLDILLRYCAQDINMNKISKTLSKYFHFGVQVLVRSDPKCRSRQTVDLGTRRSGTTD